MAVNKWKVLLSGFFAVASCVGLCIGASAQAFAEEASRQECMRLAGRARTVLAQAVRVVDGDTMKVSISGRQLSVRMLSIDTPETNFQGKNQGIWGERATRFLADQVSEGEPVTIEFEGERCDKYGRLLGHVFAGGVHLNRLMLQQGLAVNYCIYPNIKYCGEFGEIVHRNIRARKGIFADRGVEIPYVWRRIVSKREWDKYTGNAATGLVYDAEDMERVPVESRVFFMREEDVRPPFRFAD